MLSAKIVVKQSKFFMIPFNFYKILNITVIYIYILVLLYYMISTEPFLTNLGTTLGWVRCDRVLVSFNAGYKA